MMFVVVMMVAVVSMLIPVLVVVVAVTLMLVVLVVLMMMLTVTMLLIMVAMVLLLVSAVLLLGPMPDTLRLARCVAEASVSRCRAVSGLSDKSNARSSVSDCSAVSGTELSLFAARRSTYSTHPQLYNDSCQTVVLLRQNDKMRLRDRGNIANHFTQCAIKNCTYKNCRRNLISNRPMTSRLHVKT